MFSPFEVPGGLLRLPVDRCGLFHNIRATLVPDLVVRKELEFPMVFMACMIEKEEGSSKLSRLSTKRSN